MSRNLRRIPFVAAVAVSLLSLLTPGPDLPRLSEDVWDKAGHAALFALLAGTGILATLTWRRLAAGLLAYAVLTETLQALLPIHRSGDWHDVVADSVGIAAGLLVAVRISRLWRRFAVEQRAGR